MTLERARFSGGTVGNNFYTVGGRSAAGGFNGTTETQKYVGSCGPTPTPVATNTPCATCPTNTRTSTPTPTQCVAGYVYATSTGTIVPGTTDTGNHGDDIATNIALPFPFSLYGTSYTSANVISNGNLQFVTSNTAFTNSCLPAATHGPAIMPFWEDLRTDSTGTCTGGCGIYTSVSGTAPNRIFNIEWRTYYFAGAGNAYFEIRLYETGGNFDVIIGTLDQNTSATTGVQDGGTNFTQYQCNTSIANGLRLAFTPSGCGPTNTPTRTNTPGGVTNTPTRTNTPGACNPTWVAGPSITPGRHLFQGALGTDQKFYIVGGQTTASTATAVPNVEAFDPASNTWTQRAPMQVGVGQVSVGGANGKIFAAGGFIGGSVVTSTLQIYDIATNTWSFGPSLPGIEEAGAGVVLGNFFYVIGGDDFNAVVATVYRLDLTTMTWSTRAPLPAGRSNTSATAAGGFIYVFGGVIGTTFTADDHLLRYDPAANTWTDLGSAGTGGRGNYGTITPFGAGRLLVTDGGNTGFVPVATTHIYDIASNTWSPGPSMATARLGQAWGQLADGRIIEAGGLGAGTPQPILASTEILPSCGPGLQGVQITGFAFSPPTLSVAAGTTVRWTNMDPDAHTSTSTSVPPVWNSGSLAQNQFFQWTFNTPGSYPYFCAFHPTMLGTINVTP
jgi:hypothetical protein